MRVLALQSPCLQKYTASGIFAASSPYAHLLETDFR
jgi:hypothetical protein